MMYSCETMGKGIFIKRMAAVRNNSHSTNANIIMEKIEGQRGRVKDNEFSGVK